MFVGRDSVHRPERRAGSASRAAQRWTRDTRKTAVSAELELQAGEPDEPAPCEHALSPADEREWTTAVHRAWNSDVYMTEPPWP